jgi:hypothetical protein
MLRQSSAACACSTATLSISLRFSPNAIQRSMIGRACSRSASRILPASSASSASSAASASMPCKFASQPGAAAASAPSALFVRVMKSKNPSTRTCAGAAV